MYYSIFEDETLIEDGKISLPSIPAREKTKLTLPYQLDFVPKAGARYFLNISYQLRATTAYAVRGYELASASFELPIKAAGIEVVPNGKISVHETATLLSVEGTNFTATFDTVRGTLQN